MRHSGLALAYALAVTVGAAHAPSVLGAPALEEIDAAPPEDQPGAVPEATAKEDDAARSEEEIKSASPEGEDEAAPADEVAQPASPEDPAEVASPRDETEPEPADGQVKAAPSPEEAEAAAEAQRRGSAMYAYDQAALRAAERLREDAAKSGGLEALRERGLRGYVAEPFLGSFETVFYGEKDGRQFALARYSFADGKIAGGGLLGPDASDDLSPLAHRMIAALDKAGEAMAKPGHQVCSKSPPSSIILPHDGGLSVYILTSTTDPKVFPAGGHYRFDFDAEGELVSERRFMTGCFPIDLEKVPAGTRPTLLVTHLLDPQPTEIHSFVSQNVPLNLAVVTAPNRYLWQVQGGKISFLDDKPPPGIPESAFDTDPEAEPTGDTEPGAGLNDAADKANEPEADETAAKSEEAGEKDTPVGPDKVDQSKLPPPHELPPGR